MYRLSAENEYGDDVVLTGNEKRWQIISVEGLNPPKANVNVSSVAGMDGGVFNSSRLDVRNLVITLKLNGNVEQNRLDLYRVFKSKRYVKVSYSNDSLSVYAEGYVDSIECSLFSNSERMQISVICCDPYFKSVGQNDTEIGLVQGGFVFPFSIGEEGVPFGFLLTEASAVITNNGESETGMRITMDVIGNVSDPVITNTVTEGYLGISGSFVEDDTIVIDTVRGRKSITLLRDGTTTSLIGSMTSGSTWLQLISGVNRLALSGNGIENVIVTVSYRMLYEAV